MAVIGDVLHSRVARSNLWTLFAMGASVTLCGPATLLPGTLAHCGATGAVSTTTNIEVATGGADVVMALRIQKERQDAGLIPSLRDYIRGYQVNAQRVGAGEARCAGDAPRSDERRHRNLAGCCPRRASVIEEQVSNGVAVRMAVLYLTARGGTDDRKAAD